MKRKIILLIFIVTVLALITLRFFNYSQGDSTKIAEIDGKKFQVELAVSDEERKKGLDGRDGICSDCGMLFIFSKPGIYNFWMKDMRFNLDIIWTMDSKIVYIAKDVNFRDMSLKSSFQPADKVLEINGGLADKYGFTIGDEMKIN